MVETSVTNDKRAFWFPRYGPHVDCKRPAFGNHMRGLRFCCGPSCCPPGRRAIASCCVSCRCAVVEPPSCCRDVVVPSSSAVVDVPSSRHRALCAVMPLCHHAFVPSSCRRRAVVLSCCRQNRTKFSAEAALSHITAPHTPRHDAVVMPSSIDSCARAVWLPED